MADGEVIVGVDVGVDEHSGDVRDLRFVLVEVGCEGR